MSMSRPPTAPPSRTEAEHHSEAEYGALLSMLGQLDDNQWEASTDCPPWTVRDMVAHITGSAEEAVRLRVQMRHLRAAKRAMNKPGSVFVDALNTQQIADRTGCDHSAILAELTDLATKAPRARRKTPWFIRRRALPAQAGGLPGDVMAYLIDVIYTRDLWLHRIDIARATGCELARSNAEEFVVAQVIRDLDRSWTADPFELILTGRVTGTWTVGGTTIAPERIEMDCVAAARLWSGRSDETGLRPDGPVRSALLATRLLF